MTTPDEDTGDMVLTDCIDSFDLVYDKIKRLLTGNHVRALKRAEGCRYQQEH